MTYHAGLEQVILIGGVPAGKDGGPWGWDGTRWSPLGGDAGPGPRGHFALAYDPKQDVLLLHGGFVLRFGEDVGEDERYGDLWAWNSTAWTLIHGSDEGPGVRDHHAMAYDVARHELVLFGGGRGASGNRELLRQTWIYDGQRWRTHEGVSPPPRGTHRMVYDDSRNRIVLFGGWGEDGLLNDTWEWDGTAWVLASETGPSPRFATRMAYDAHRQRVVLFGGRGEAGDFADTWEWDGDAWTLVAETGPSLRNVHGMAYDRRRAQVVLYGGFHAGNRLQDTWAWDGLRWEQLN